MTWLIIVIVANLFYALVYIVDKYIISRPMPHPVVYAFYVSILGIFILVLLPFGFNMPSGSEVLWCLLAGAAQLIGLILFYKTLNKGEVSRIVPFIGAVSPVFVLILSSFLTKEFLSPKQIIAFALLVLGSFVIGLRRKEFLGKKILGIAIISAFLFALFWVITKYIFLGTSFISGLIWIRVGVALVALTLLLSKKNRELIFQKTKEAKPKTTGFFLLGRGLNMAGSLFLYGAVFLGSVSLVNALQGLQYAFILVLAFLFFKKIPNLKEQFNREIITQKIAAVVLIFLGLFILVI